jgi:hypothetical protein
VDPPRTPAPESAARPSTAPTTPAPSAAAAAPPAVRATDHARPTAARRTADAPARPAGAWYQRDPWLALLGLAVLLGVAAVFAPRAAVVPLIGAGGVCMIVGLALLLRRGLFPPPGEL